MGRRNPGFLLVVVLLVGLGAGYCFGLARGGDDAPASANAEKPRAAKRPPADVGDAAILKALRARVADLERQLAAAREEGRAAATNAVASLVQGGTPGPRMDPRAWMEDLKKNDPERYAQMTNRFARFKQRLRERQRRNLDFLASVDTSTMSAAAKKTHAALQKAIALRAELDERIGQEGLSDDERRSLMERIMASERNLRGLRRAERSNLFAATATALGFEGDDVNEIVATLGEVVDATEGHGGRHMGPPPHDGRGPR